MGLSNPLCVLGEPFKVMPASADTHLTRHMMSFCFPSTTPMHQPDRKMRRRLPIS